MRTDIETGIIELRGSAWELKNYPIVEGASAEIPSRDFQMEYHCKAVKGHIH